jgi:hypothetical protein
MPVRFHRAATAEAVAARDWYEHARRGLGVRFVAEVERVINLVEQYPSRFPFHTVGIRRASLRRFPFSIFFEKVDNVTYVWAIFHHRRDPSTIEQRRS